MGHPHRLLLQLLRLCAYRERRRCESDPRLLLFVLLWMDLPRLVRAKGYGGCGADHLWLFEDVLLRLVLPTPAVQGARQPRELHGGDHDGLLEEGRGGAGADGDE